MSYRLPKECCATCNYSEFSQYGDPSCTLMIIIAKPFPHTQDNVVDLGGSCDFYQEAV